MDARIWRRQNRGFEISTALDALSPQQRYQFESSVPPALWTWLWNLPMPSEQEPESVPADEPAPVDEPESVPEPAPVDEPASEPEPTLEELKALLLARDSLVQINSLKRKHSKTVAIAYNSMNVEEQSHVDALAALAVPHKVFKYLGDEIKQGQARLIKGTLVYLDPQAQERSNSYTAPVWAINGVTSGWFSPINVSLSLLQEVVKVVLPDEQDGGQLRGLI